MRHLVLVVSIAVAWAFALAARGNTQSDDLDALQSQVSELYAQGKYSQALPIAEHLVDAARARHGEEHAKFAVAIGWLGSIHQAQGRYEEAEPLYKRSLAIVEKALGPDNPDVAVRLNNLAELYRAQGRYEEAEPLYTRALGITESALGPDNAALGTRLNNLGELYRAQGRYEEAELVYKRALAISEKALGLEHATVGIRLNNLGELYRAQGRYQEAEPLYKRALGISEKSLGADHPTVGIRLNNLGELYRAQRRYEEAEPLYKRALGISEKSLGPEHPSVAIRLNNLGELYRGQGRYEEAEPFYKRALEISEKSLGPEHPSVAIRLSNLAELYQAQGRHAEAEQLYTRALGISEKALGPEHPTVGLRLNNLAELSFLQGDWPRAVDYWRRATGIVTRRATLGAGGASSVGGKGKSEAERKDSYFRGLIKAAFRLAPQTPKTNSSGEGLAAEMFEAAQWAQSSEAATTLAQMAVRETAGDASLAALVRERQDLVGEWQAKDKQLIAAKSELPDKRNAGGEKALGDRLAAIDTRLTEIDRALGKNFPDYAALASPKSLSIKAVQSLLRDDEALVAFLDTSEMKPALEETFIWAVTKTDSRWVRSELGTKSLQEGVSSLRCGLDESAWSGAGQARCMALLGFDPKQPPPRQLPFDRTKAHELYKSLFSGIEGVIDGKHLLVVPSGPLTSLPMQVLVTAPSGESDLAATAWLLRNHALTVLPSVASLEALRRPHRLGKGGPGAADTREAFIGFGNPVLTRSCGSVFVPDKCPDEEMQVAAVEEGTARSAGDLESAGTFMRGGIADVAALKSRLCPLPDTAFELKCVAHSLGATDASLVLGKDMTETNVKHMALDKYRVVHFATHGLLAGETAQLAKERAEPALVFSPPETGTVEDDGLLTASEVAGLRLDADWIVMSACNTASGAEPGAEALSGLAKAFFYAGARALLVSHWPVNSYAATMLTSRTFAELRKEQAIGPSEAFRRAMLALMSDRNRPWAAHPAVWAPFVVVGEGGSISDAREKGP